MRNEPVILVAEDDENDVLLLRRALETAKVFAPSAPEIQNRVEGSAKLAAPGTLL